MSCKQWYVQHQLKEEAAATKWTSCRHQHGTRGGKKKEEQVIQRRNQRDLFPCCIVGVVTQQQPPTGGKRDDNFCRRRRCCLARGESRTGRSHQPDFMKKHWYVRLCRYRMEDWSDLPPLKYTYHRIKADFRTRKRDSFLRNQFLLEAEVSTKECFDHCIFNFIFI